MKFFSAEGPLMRALSNLVTLLLLNIMTAICCLPVITAGAALSSLHYMIMKMMDGEDAHLWKRYFTQFRGNLKTSTGVWIVFLLVGVFLWFDYHALLGQNDNPLRVLMVPLWVLLFLAFLFFVWIFPVLARFDCGFAGAFRNAGRLAIGSLPRTLLMAVIWFVTTFVLSQSWKLLPLFFLFGLSLPAYFSALVYYPVIRKLIERKEEESSAETETEQREEPEVPDATQDDKDAADDETT